ncbi:hypothetical protein M5D96_014056 [Drosophila gunungcola]|uniref:Translation initiation factor IF-2 n=1 Tax=Drosophila gunungcola TaxID=103775 RepID=A0A9P9YA64_9MUSC|nr:hypothetical protein M5D96_014056 [Drosophila gunungcola]
MKISAALALLLIAGFVASGDALPARKRMVYLQQPAAAEWYGSAPQQRFMYMQYVQPGRTHARSTQAASAIVAGETVATGTYLKAPRLSRRRTSWLPPVPTVPAPWPRPTPTRPPSSKWPSMPTKCPCPCPCPRPSQRPSLSPRPPTTPPRCRVTSTLPPRRPPLKRSPFPCPSPRPSCPLPAPIAPVAAVVPANRYLPAKKKVIVELDQEEEEEPQAAAIEDEEEVENAVADDVEEDEEELSVPVKPVNPVRVPNARRPAAKKPAKAAAPAGGKPSKKPAAPLPAGTFFPIDFGGTNGGAIAIANSFSTGEGGSATSHAIAYGSPESAARRVRPNPSKFRH